MSVPGTTLGSIAEASAEILRREIGGTIVLSDPPYTFGRQMIVRHDDGSTSRVPYDHELVCLQRAAMIARTWHAPTLAREAA